MNLYDIIGPVMVGPSSSHTAGAVKIGYVSRKLMAQPIVKAQILLYGSFLATGKGHGTQIAIVAGLLGMKTDDCRIPDSFRLAKETGMGDKLWRSGTKGCTPEFSTADLNWSRWKTTGDRGRVYRWFTY